MGQLIITNSSRTTFLECQYSYFLEYVRRLTSTEEAVYFRWGRLVHEVSEGLSQLVPPIETVETIRKRVEEEPDITPELLEWYEDALWLVIKVFQAWMLKYYEADKRYEVLETEVTFELVLPSGALFKGKIDKIVRDIITRIIYVWEIKTAAQTGDTFWECLPLDSQPKGYCLAASRVLGFACHDVIYDIFKKPQLRQLKNESGVAFRQRLADAYLEEDGKYFERSVPALHYTTEQLDAYYLELDDVAKTIQWHTNNGIWLKHHSRNRKGGCTFQALCLYGEKQILMQKFRIRSAAEHNPELPLITTTAKGETKQDATAISNSD